MIVFALAVAVGCAHRPQTVTDGTTQPQAPPPAVATEPHASSAPGAETPAKTKDDDFAFLEELEPASPQLVADPLEPYNRAMFYFNDKLYFWVLKPLARGYNAVLPEVVRIGVRNFFSNVTTPIRFVNCLLQGKGTAAGTELGRFALNTTVGVLGFWDPAQTYFDLRISDEDLGQTFGAYGIGNGFYIIWPVLGSSTLRDSFGFAGDLFLNPISYIDSTAWAVGVGAYRRFNDLSFRLGEYEAIKEAAVEPYEAVRDGYLQFRRALVEQ